MPKKTDPATKKAQAEQYEIIDSYVLQYQRTRHKKEACETGDHVDCRKQNQAASTALLERFGAYLDRFVYQIKNARIRPRRRHVWDESFPRRYSQWLKMYDAEDVKQDLIMTFLRCVEKYDVRFKEARGVNFCGYLNRAFLLSLKDYLYNGICHMTDGPYSSAEDREVTDGHSGVGSGDSGEGQDFDHFEGLVRDPGMASPQDWINGLTAAAPFDYLNAEERQLVYLRYVENKTFRQISKQLHMTDRAVQEQHRQIVKDLEGVATMLNLLYTDEELSYRY